MTPERLEEIRELMAALHFPTLGGVATECRVCALLDSMGHGESTIACPSCACAELLAEVDRLRAAADGLKHYVTIRRDDIRDSLKSGLLEGPERWCAAREGTTLTETLDRGRELGLFTDKP